MFSPSPKPALDSFNFDIAILALTDVSTDSRVLRQLDVARSLGSVACISPGSMPIAGVTHVSVPRASSRGKWQRRAAKLMRLATMSTGQHDRYYWSRPEVKALRRQYLTINARVTVANDLETLPVAVRHVRNTEVVFDAHEFYPGQQSGEDLSGRLWNQYSDQLCKQYMPAASSVLTVSPGIGRMYQERYGSKCLECLNCPAPANCVPGALREDGRIRLVHHGAYRTNRGIERLVRMMPLLPGHFELHLLLTGDQQSSGFRALKREVAGLENVTIHPPVSPDGIAAAINQYDVGVYLLDPVNVNHQLALPNKFFEFIQARLAVAIGPSPEMASIVRKHGLGLVADDFSEDALADQLRHLNPGALQNFKMNSDKAAQIYNAHQSTQSLKNELLRILKRSQRGAA